MNLLNVAANVLWILSLSIMAGAAQVAWRRMDPDVRVPMHFTSKGAPVLRLRRNLGLALFPVLAMLLGLFLMAINRNATGEQAVIVFGIRATFAALVALFHLRWLKAAMEQLEAEGALRS